MRRAGKRVKAKGGAKLPVAKSSRSNESSRVRDLEKQLAEAQEREAKALKREAEALGQLETRSRDLAETREQQTATAEILRVIASSPTDVRPVFDAILDSALRLCASPVGALMLFDGEAFRLVAHRGAPGSLVEALQRPQRHGPHTGTARAVAERRPVQIADMMADPAYEERDPIRVKSVELLGSRTALYVPMLKNGMPLGVIMTWRTQVQTFTESQIQLLSRP
jgi:transcriptional regulator with GAF, ATPase, and Fis domain